MPAQKKDEEDKVHSKSYKWTTKQLRDFPKLAEKLGMKENALVRLLTDMGQSVVEVKVKEEGYTIMPLNLRDAQIAEIERVANETGYTTSEIMRMCIDSQFGLDEDGV